MSEPPIAQGVTLTLFPPELVSALTSHVNGQVSELRADLRSRV